jgi:hypothetical protein
MMDYGFGAAGKPATSISSAVHPRRSSMVRTVSILAVATACLFLAAPGFAAENQPKSARDVAVDQCNALIKQFKMQNVGHVDKATLEQARRKIFYAEKSCKSDPQNGIKTVNSAFDDINVRPRH